MITIQLHGRLTRDPELRELDDRTKLAALRIAANDSRGRTVYLNCAEFGKSGEATARTLSKGSEVVFHGELRFREVGGDKGRREYYSAIGRTEFVGPRNGDQPAAPAEPTTPDPDDIPF
jgi:single-stranded DNA-binding protein